MNRITFDVDSAMLFEMLNKVQDWGPIGTRVVGAMINKPGFSEQTGMALYGINYVPPLPLRWSSDRYGAECAYVGRILCARIRKLRPPSQGYAVDYEIPVSTKVNRLYLHITVAKKNAEKNVLQFIKDLQA